MKKGLKAIGISLAAALCSLVAAPTVLAATAQTGGIDFRSGLVKYVLEDALTDAPETMEAVIKIDKDAEGFLGNLFGNKSDHTNVVNYGVNENGNLFVHWNSMEKEVVFEKTDLRNGKWTHVAAVRDKEKNGFVMYVNGKKVEEVLCGVGSEMPRLWAHHIIGGDWSTQQWVKQPFNGQIKQITVYSRGLNESEVRRDYYNLHNIKGSTRSDLLFNGYLNAGDVVIDDTSYYGNDAYLGSNDYYYDGELYEAKDYTLAVIPDIQVITNHYQKMVETLPTYLIDKKDEQKIEMAITVGDISDGITNGKDWDRQFNKLEQQFNRLDGVMPYVINAGNHDYDGECGSGTDHALTHLDGAFPVSKMSTWDEWGGTYNGSVVNAYYLAEYGGVKYLVFAIDFGPNDDVLEWCCDVTERYPDRRVIVSTHGFLYSDGSPLQEDTGVGSGRPKSYGFKNSAGPNDADGMWDKFLRKYPNIFMVLCGHIQSDTVVNYEMVGDHGNVVTAFLVDMQGMLMSYGLESMLALFNFDEKNQLIYMNVASTISEKLFEFQNQYVYSFAGKTPIASTLYYPSGKATDAEIAAMKEAYAEAKTDALVQNVTASGLFTPSVNVSVRDNFDPTFIIAFAAAIAVGGAVGVAVSKKRKGGTK